MYLYNVTRSWVENCSYLELSLLRNTNYVYRSILLFPEGNNQANAPIYHVSVYVKLVDIEKDKETYACAQFATLVSRPSDPTNYHCLGIYLSLFYLLLSVKHKMISN